MTKKSEIVVWSDSMLSSEMQRIAGVKHIVAEIEGYSCPVEESVKKSLDYLLDAPFVKASYSK